MWSKRLYLTIVASFFLHADARSHVPRPHHYARSLHARDYVTESTVGDSYDFIIAGGGLAGLVIASRLSEDPDTTVLVLEAGESGDAEKDSIDPPAGTYYNSLVGTSYDWQHRTTEQDKAGGRSLPWPRGKVLGGSTAINGMYYVRPSEIEVEAWKGMLDSNADAATWGWDNLLKAMKKSETFTPPTSDVQTTAKIQFEASSYGTNGPLHVTYPGFMYSVVGDWTPSLEAAGIGSAADPAGGKNFGGFVSTLSINPGNWTRSYSKSAYIDPLPPRKNLHILVSATVTRIVFGDKNTAGDHVASGVEFATSASGAKKVVKVNKEVIVTGGALGSPNVLMHSGVGPKDVLDAAGVPVVVDLPGVGQHLQDHLAAPVVWESKVETAGDIQTSGSDFSKQPATMSFVNSAIAYINASTLFGDSAELERRVAAALDSSVQTVPSKSNEVIEGYKAIYGASQKFLTQAVGQIELLLSINSPKAITIQAALQHPFSQGRVYIDSKSAFDPIVIDPQYFSHPADLAIMREGIKLARRIGQTEPMRSALGAETFPGPDVSTDGQIEDWLQGAVSTEFHPQATCSMLPKSLGGVVNAKLQVYGLANVRVADSSVFPLSFSAHLAAPTFGLAEEAADILKAFYKAPEPTNSDSFDPPSSPSETDEPDNNGASAILASSGTLVTMALAGMVTTAMASLFY
ncbi:hypothetical protein D9615_006577 [Tricholomella constricta]|uniref:Glucose-methanol-choline oxidoreductase N-terminal domain-containing protein n=1 Tax=Tricholomella constricta TaxID=117010 RepID=A0A8H5HA60_9AGAR|nr:hypothetical protein D9615_006577 [Tricholomella constricta]